MDLGSGWNLPDSVLRKVVLLEYIADKSGGSTSVPLPDDAQEAGTEAHRIMVADLHEFRDAGWIQLVYGGGAESFLIAPGSAAVEDIRAKRANKPARCRAARDAVLHWLHECYLTGSGTPNLTDFFRAPYSLYDGRPFETDEIDKATHWLREQDYITGQGAWGGGIIRPTITAKGEQTVDSGRSVNDALPVAGSGVHITGDHNTVQAGSPAATQHVVTTITDDHRTQTLRLADLVEQSLPGLMPDGTPILFQVKSAVRSTPKNPARSSPCSTRRRRR